MRGDDRRYHLSRRIDDVREFTRIRHSIRRRTVIMPGRKNSFFPLSLNIPVLNRPLLELLTLSDFSSVPSSVASHCSDGRIIPRTAEGHGELLWRPVASLTIIHIGRCVVVFIGFRQLRCHGRWHAARVNHFSHRGKEGSVFTCSRIEEFNEGSMVAPSTRCVWKNRRRDDHMK